MAIVPAARQRFEESIMVLARGFFAILIAASMLFAIGCASTSTQESTGEYIDDATITTKVKTAIFNEPSLKVFQINVETYKNVVQLSGFVNSNADVYKAASVARSVKGVVSVKNDILLK
jgi:osmotically-inducible protein OsmY